MEDEFSKISANKDLFNEKLKKLTEQVENQYSQLEKACDNPSMEKTLTDFFIINNFIRKSIELNFKNLNSFLNELDLTKKNINDKHYLEKSIFNEDIIKYCSFPQLELNFNNSDITEAIKEKIKIFEKQKEIESYSITKETQSKTVAYLRESGRQIKKITIDGIDTDSHLLLNSTGPFTTLVELEIKNSTLNLLDESQTEEKGHFVKLANLSIYNCAFVYYYRLSTLFPFGYGKVFPPITILKLEKCQLGDKDFKELFENIIGTPKSSLSSSLLTLSFAYNYITCFNYSRTDAVVESFPFFANLEELNFMGNRIYQFLISNYAMFGKLKILNLINNYIGNDMDNQYTFYPPIEKKEEPNQQKKEEQKKDEPKQDEVKKEEPKQDEVKKDEQKKDEQKKEEQKKEEPKQDEVKKEEPKQDEVKKEEPKQDEVKKDEQKKDEPKQDEVKKEEIIIILTEEEKRQEKLKKEMAPIQKFMKLCNQNPYLLETEKIAKYNRSMYLRFLKFKEEGFPYLTQFCFSGLYTSNTQSELLEIVQIAKMENLSKLDLSYCSINAIDIIVLSLSKFTNLHFLNLKGNLITMSLFKALKKILFQSSLNVEDLNLSSNYIEDEDFGDMIEVLRNFSSLKHLDLTLNPFGRNYSLSRDKEKDKVIDKKAVNEEEKENMMPKDTSPYLVSEDDRKGPNYSFCGLLGAFYPCEKEKKFYVDFTVDLKDRETKDVICENMEQQRKQYKVIRKGNKENK